MEILITKGTYNTSDYRVVKKYSNKESAMKFLKTIGYPYDELDNDTWNKHGIKYRLQVQYGLGGELGEFTYSIGGL